MMYLRTRRAFTLIELIIVIAIIVIMLAVALPISTNAIAERSLYNAAVQVQQDIRLAQQLAISHSTTDKFKIHFYPASNYYTVETSAEDASKIITRRFNDAYGFPEYFGVSFSPSVYFKKLDTDPPDPIKKLFFDNLGNPHVIDSSSVAHGDGQCYINLQNRAGSKKIQIIVSVIGRVNIVWIQR